MPILQRTAPLAQHGGRTRVRCLVCGSSEVRTDEVAFRGLLILNECPRCAHRWTHGEPPRSVASLRSAPSREVSSAA